MAHVLDVSGRHTFRTGRAAMVAGIHRNTGGKQMKRHPELVIGAVLFVVGAAMLAVVFLHVGPFRAPTVMRAPAAVTCPTEDSCNVDYYGHAWHITLERHS